MESPNDLARRFWEWLRHPRLRTLFPLLGGGLAVLLILLLHDAISDLLHAINTNILEPFFVKTVLPWLGNTVSLPGWTTVLLTLVSIAALTLSILYLRLLLEARATSSDTLEVLTSSVRGLERTLQAYLDAVQQASMGMSSERIEETARFLLLNLVEEIAKLYRGKVSRGGILIRSKEDEDYLWWYVTDDMTISSMRKKYYIGDFGVERRSVAGDCWRSGKPQRCHVDRATGTGDHPAYVRSMSFQPGEYKYTSFVILPLCEAFLWSERSDGPSGGQRSSPECIGVVCLDSSQYDTFDKDPLFSVDPKSDAFAKVYLRAMFRVLAWRERAAR